MKINIRKAKDDDRYDIALCISEAFEKDFKVLCKDIITTAKAISSGIVIDKFYVAELDNKIIGTLAKNTHNKNDGYLSSFSIGIK